MGPPPAPPPTTRTSGGKQANCGCHENGRGGSDGDGNGGGNADRYRGRDWSNTGGSTGGIANWHARQGSVQRACRREACVFVVGEYELLRLIGKGSYGSVFSCRHMQTGHVACAKLEELRSESAQVIYEYRVYSVLAKTSAREFVPVPYCHGEAGDYRYMVMGLGGEDLSTVVHTHTAASKLRIFRSAITALRAIHDAGIVHRDIKPTNILMRADSSEEVMIIDFGLAKRYRDGARHIDNRDKDSISGTTRYASVPCMMCTQTSRRDDMYSLCYTMASLFGRALPWQNLTGKKEDEEKILLKTLELKRVLEPRIVFHGCPEPVIHIYAAVIQLGFAERPAYEEYQQIIDNYLCTRPNGACVRTAYRASASMHSCHQ